MRIGIFDILLLMLLAALATVHYTGRRDVANALLQLEQTELILDDTLIRIDIVRRHLEYAQERNDYANEVELAYSAAIRGFEQVRQRYGKITPEPGMVVYCTVPEVAEQANVSLLRVRISIPTEYPVLLRSGSSQGEYPDGDPDKRTWPGDAQLENPQNCQVQLEPGIHDLCFLKGQTDSHVWFELQLDNKPLIRNKFLFESSGYGSSSPGGYDPRRIDLQGESDSLFGINAKREDSVKHFYRVWLSGNIESQRFDSFPKIQSGAADNE
ncbi:MAG: hypothetical protein AAF497_03530 [Planctomycetota bacterium]